MITRLVQYFMALLMAAPMYLCCQLGAMTQEAAPVAADACQACRLLTGADETPTAPMRDSKTDCPCCTGTLERNLSPDTAAAPRLVLVDLQAWVWWQAEDLLPPTRREHEARVHHARVDPGPPRREAPLFLRHCALLT